jgi:hypothetical protein
VAPATKEKLNHRLRPCSQSLLRSPKRREGLPPSPPHEASADATAKAAISGGNNAVGLGKGDMSQFVDMRPIPLRGNNPCRYTSAVWKRARSSPFLPDAGRFPQAASGPAPFTSCRYHNLEAAKGPGPSRQDQPADAATSLWRVRMTVLADHGAPVGVSTLRLFSSAAMARADIPASSVRIEDNPAR